MRFHVVFKYKMLKLNIKLKMFYSLTHKRGLRVILTCHVVVHPVEHDLWGTVPSGGNVSRHFIISQPGQPKVQNLSTDIRVSISHKQHLSALILHSVPQCLPDYKPTVGQQKIIITDVTVEKASDDDGSWQSVQA